MYIAVGDKGELFVTEHWDYQYVVLDTWGQRVLTKKMSLIGGGCPTGIATDGEGNVYVASGHVTMTDAHKMQKFNRCGDVVKSVGKWGRHVREFDWPFGVRYHNHHVYVCDSGNGRVQVFDVRSFGTHGGLDQLNRPRDIDFDTQGNIYVVSKKTRLWCSVTMASTCVTLARKGRVRVGSVIQEDCVSVETMCI